MAEVPPVRFSLPALAWCSRPLRRRLAEGLLRATPRAEGFEGHGRLGRSNRSCGGLGVPPTLAGFPVGPHPMIDRAPLAQDSISTFPLSQPRQDKPLQTRKALDEFDKPTRDVAVPIISELGVADSYLDGTTEPRSWVPLALSAGHAPDEVPGVWGGQPVRRLLHCDHRGHKRTSHRGCGPTVSPSASGVVQRPHTQRYATSAATSTTVDQNATPSFLREGGHGGLSPSSARQPLQAYISADAQFD